VYYIESLAKFKRPAHINAELDYCLACEHMPRGIIQQRVKQFHADDDVPADAACMFYHCVVFVADDIRGAFEFGHQHELAHDFLDKTPDIRRYALFVHALRADRPDLGLALRDCDDFYRSAVSRAKVFAHGFKDAAVTPLAQEP